MQTIVAIPRTLRISLLGLIALFCSHSSQARADILSLEVLQERHLEKYDDPRAFRWELEKSLTKVSPEEDPELWVALHAYAAEAAWFQEELASSKEHVAAALPLAEAKNYPKLLAMLTYLKAGNFEYDADAETAEKYFKEAVEMAKATQDDALIAYISSTAGAFSHRSGKRNQAVEFYRDAFQRFQKLPQDAAYYDALSSIGTLYVQSVGPRQAEGMKMILESLQYAKEKKLRYEIYWINHALDTLYHNAGDSEKSNELINENIRLAESLGYDNYIANSRLNRGQLRMAKGQYQQAAEDLEFARDYFRERQISFYDVLIFAELGNAYLNLHRLDKIPTLLKNYAGTLKENSSPMHKETVNKMLARYYHAVGDKEKELSTLRILVELVGSNAEAKRSEELGRLTKDMEVQRQQFLNDKLTDENRSQNAEIQRRDRMQRLMLGILAMGGLALLASAVALRRGREIRVQRANLKIILDNIEEGILRFGADFKIRGEYSRFTGDLLDRSSSLLDQDIWQILFEETNASAADRQVWLESLRAVFGETRLAWDLNEGNLPGEVAMRSRTLALGWQPLADAEGTTQTVLLLIRDITQQIAMQEETRVAQERASKMADRIEAIARSRPVRVAAFLVEAERTIAPLQSSLDTNESYSDIKRMLHTLKGAARSLGLKDISEIVHAFEDLFTATNLDRAVFQRHMQDLAEALGSYRELLPHLNMAQIQTVENLWDIASKLIPEARQRLASRFTQLAEFQIVDNVGSWDRVDRRLVHDMLLHAITNSIDHGFLLPHARGERMPETPQLALEARESQRTLEITVRDNGFGINWDKLRAMADERRFQPQPGRELTDLLFLEGTSTAGQVSTTSGRGMGMAAILDMARKLGGDVSLHDNERSRGACLRIVLPLSTAQNAVA